MGQTFVLDRKQAAEQDKSGTSESMAIKEVVDPRGRRHYYVTNRMRLLQRGTNQRQQRSRPGTPRSTRPRFYGGPPRRFTPYRPVSPITGPRHSPQMTKYLVKKRTRDQDLLKRNKTWGSRPVIQNREALENEIRDLVISLGGETSTKKTLGLGEITETGNDLIVFLSNLFSASMPIREQADDGDQYGASMDPLGGIRSVQGDSAGSGDDDFGIYHMVIDVPLEDYQQPVEGDLEAGMGAASTDGDSVKISAQVISSQVNGGSLPDFVQLDDPMFVQFDQDKPGWDATALWIAPIVGLRGWIEPFVVEYARSVLGMSEQEAQEEANEIEYGATGPEGNDADGYDPDDMDRAADDERRDGRFTYDDQDDEQGD